MCNNKLFNEKKNEDAIDVLNQVHDLFKEAEVDAVSLMPFWIGAQSQ